LKEAMVSSGFSQKRLSELVGVDVTSINKYVLGERRPSPEVAKKIASIIKIDWTRFYEDEASLEEPVSEEGGD